MVGASCTVAAPEARHAQGDPRQLGGGWAYGGEYSPGDISRGLFAGEVGVPRVLELFRRAGVRQTFFWSGHSIETFPTQFEACVAAGHEIGVHGYSHENHASG